MFLSFKVLVCNVGALNCRNKWHYKLTPLGLCQEIRLVGDDDFDKLTPQPKNRVKKKSKITFFQRSYPYTKKMALMVATNLSDSTFGLDGTRTGVTLYYYDRTAGLKENHKIEMTSSMISENVIILKRSRLLGVPYTPCSTRKK